ncbi:MAG: aminotransferase class III-fold pyridoxal phosphate-dependent enzyme [Candidatus Omnitrophota bacterium]
MAKEKLKKKQGSENKALFERAKRYLVGGVNSPIRSFKYVGIDPILIKEGKGPRVYDYDGNSYVDYALSYGAIILGHAYPGVIKALKTTIGKGLHFGTTNIGEIELASIIQKAIPSMEKMRFVNSGTEAVMSSVKLAKGYTGRKKVVKFIDSYHGHADDIASHAISVEFNNKPVIKKVFERYGADIACLIVEPIGGNHGVVIPKAGYLRYLRNLTREYGSLLIFDEVITGFRFGFGSSADIFGVKPDIFCLGKIVGGGLPIGVYGGRKDIMDNLAPLGKIYQGSTFSGNPVVMRSGIAALRALFSLKHRYQALELMVKYLCDGINKIAETDNIDMKTVYFGTMFSIRFKRPEEFRSFYRFMIQNSVYFAPSEYEANFISFSHTKKNIKETLILVKRALRSIKYD